MQWCGTFASKWFWRDSVWRRMAEATEGIITFACPHRHLASSHRIPKITDTAIGKICDKFVIYRIVTDEDVWKYTGIGFAISPSMSHLPRTLQKTVDIHRMLARPLWTMLASHSRFEKTLSSMPKNHNSSRPSPHLHVTYLYARSSLHIVLVL